MDKKLIHYEMWDEITYPFSEFDGYWLRMWLFIHAWIT